MKFLKNGYVRDTSGRFSSFKKKVRRIINGMLAFSVFLTAVAAYGYMQPILADGPEISIVEKVVTVKVDETKNKLDQLKSDILDDLKFCESGDMDEAQAPIILDTNHEMSVGLYMFQRNTVIHYYKVLYGEELTRKQAVEIAIDYSKARSLASDILFTTENGWKDWWTCSKKLDLEQKINVIRQLQ